MIKRMAGWRCLLSALLFLVGANGAKAQTAPHWSRTYNPGAGSTGATPQGGGTWDDWLSSKGDVKATVGYVASNAALKALPVPLFPMVVRQGYVTAGDGGSAKYVYTAAACSLNVGAGDNGSQVRPASGQGCWVADFAGDLVTPMIWGAFGDGSHNDTAPFQTAINFMAEGTLYLGAHAYCVAGLNATSAINIVGWSKDAGTGLVQCGANQNVLTILGNNSSVRNLYMTTGVSAGANTSGTLITVLGANDVVSDVKMQSPCVGIDVAGNENIIENNRISNAAGAGCGGIRVGHSTTGGNTVGPHILNNIIESNGNADFGTRYEDCGGCYAEGNDILFALHNTWVIPGANQQVIFGFWTGTVMSDTASGDGVLIDTSDPTAIVESLSATNAWSSNSQGSAANVHVQNTGGGKVDSISFKGHRSYLVGGTYSMMFSAGTNISVEGSQICGLTSRIGIYLGVGVGDASLTNNRVGGNCAGYTGTAAIGIDLAGSNNNVTVQNNRLAGTSIPINLASIPTGDSIVSGNTPLAPAVTVSVGPAPSNYTAPSSGTVYIQSGVISAITLVHNGATILLSNVDQNITVGVGDIVSINYSTAPTVQFVGN